MLLCCLIATRVWPIIRFLQSLKTLSLVETTLFGLVRMRSSTAVNQRMGMFIQKSKVCLNVGTLVLFLEVK